MYTDIANQTIKKAIKSAVFIDEKSLEAYEVKPDEPAYEEELSEKLHQAFKEQGISLSVHKFQNGDEQDEDIKEYLFENRDLVLLDWKLDDQEGEEYSLQLLSDVISRDNIHFCAIYTSDPGIDNIYNSIVSFFSGKDLNFLENLKNNLSEYENDLIPILQEFNWFDVNSRENGALIPRILNIDDEILNRIKEETGENNIKGALKILKIAFEDFPKSETSLDSPNFGGGLSPDSNSLVINNTIITIVNKIDDAETDANQIISKLSEQIINSKHSFTQLLGLEMQTLFKSESSFVEPTMLQVSKEALLKHRQNIIEKEGSDLPFKELMKRVLMEQAKMSLRTSELDMLDSALLNSVYDPAFVITDDEIMLMNVFYNSSSISKNNINNAYLNFGDVFKGDDGIYYLCITALCDCLRPDGIKSNYFFAKGTNINKDIALRLGDTAFISFLSETIAVSWSSDLLGEECELFKYQPVYVKPRIYNVKTNLIIGNRIEVRRIITPTTDQVVDNGNLEFESLLYTTTLRHDYAQRIANHAFAHPLRIGVDFIKK